MGLIIIIVVVIFFYLLTNYEDPEIKKKEEMNRIAKEVYKEKERQKFIEEYGCAPEEFADRIRTSLHIETLANAILELPSLPITFEVKRDKLEEHRDMHAFLADTRSDYVISFDTYGIPPLPEEYLEALAEALADTPQLAAHNFRANSYEYTAWDTCVKGVSLTRHKIKKTEEKKPLTKW